MALYPHIPTAAELDHVANMAARTASEVDALGGAIRLTVASEKPRVVDEGVLGRLLAFADAIRLAARLLTDEAADLETNALMAYRETRDALEHEAAGWRAGERRTSAEIGRASCRERV